MSYVSVDEKRRQKARLEADRRLELMGGSLDRYARCGHVKTDGKTHCDRRAGDQTTHLGAGYCIAHGGGGKLEILISHYMMQHAAAKELNISPWEALLTAMRRSAGLAAFYDSKIALVEADEDLIPGGAAYPWIQGSERAHYNTAKYAKAALDAGVAERLVQAVELEATTMFEFFSAVLVRAGLPEEWEEKLRVAMRQEAMAIESHDNTLDGELVESDNDGTG